MPDALGCLGEQFLDAHAARVLRPRFLAWITNSGTITVRAQYETLSRWNGNHFGSSITSTGITGTAVHGTSP